MKDPFAVFFLVVLLPIASPGQFVALPDSNAEWTVTTFDGPNPIASETYVLELSDHDTLINDTLYSYLRGTITGSNVIAGFLGGLYDNSYGQVYYYNPTTARTYLLYDFDVQVGDSVLVWAAGAASPYEDLQTVVVESIELIDLQGSLRKQVTVRDTLQSATAEWIQGVGGTGGLLETCACITVSTSGLLTCMAANDTLWVGGSGQGSCLSLGLDDVLSGEPLVFFHPSMVLNELYLDVLPATEAPLDFFGQDGRLVWRERGTGHWLDVSSMASGTYVLRMTDTNGMVWCGRFIKQ